MAFFRDKYHFKNYVRKILMSYGLDKEIFENFFSDYLFFFFDFEEKYSHFFSFLKFEMCKQIATEIGHLHSEELGYIFELMRFKKYPSLKRELISISTIIDNKEINYFDEIDIRKFLTFYRYACDYNKYLEIYLLKNTLTNEFIRFVESLKYKKGLYFLYDKNKTLIYIGKSIDLSNRVLASINERGAFYISIIEAKTKSDMHLYEVYYILKEKPLLNKQCFENDKLTHELPELTKSEQIQIYL